MNVRFPDTEIFSFSSNPSIPHGDTASPITTLPIHLNTFASTQPVDCIANNENAEGVPSLHNEPPALLASAEVVEDDLRNTEEPVKEEESPPQKEYTIHTDSKSIVKLPPNYGTDDKDEKTIVDLFNGKLYEWQERKLKKGLSVFYVPFDSEYMIMTRQHFLVPFPFDTVIKAFMEPEYRKKWDKGLSNKTVVLSTKMVDNCQIDHIYTYIKMPTLFSDRDFVQKRKMWKEYTKNPRSMLIHSKSYDHDSYPMKEKPVRATIDIMGFYFEEIDANNTMYSTLSKGDFGFPHAFYRKMKEMVGDRSVDQLNDFMKACKAVGN